MTFQVQACSDAPAPVTTQPAQNIDQLLETLDLNNGRFATPQPPRWPDDLSTHPAMRSESFVLQAILHPANVQALAEESPMASVILQIDRLGLMPQSEVERAASAWHFGGVMRSGVSVDAATHFNVVDNENDANQHLSTFQALATVQPRQSAQRMALGLAGEEDNTLWVGNDRLSFDIIATAENRCLRTYRWVATVASDTRLLLDFSMDTCPLGQSIGLLSRWQQSAVHVSGFLLSVADGAGVQLTPVEGVSWFTQRWGNLPAMGGAVAIDTLQLVLDDQQVLDVSRSKRRSGRGPQTVSASVSAQSLPAKSLSVRWEDSTEKLASASPHIVPRYIRLVSEDQTIDVRVSALNQLTGQDALAGDRLQGGVVVDGTHHGVGFISYTSLAVSP